MAGSINKPKKPNSKRATARLRYKIKKASSAKARKDRKQAKKNPEWRSKLKKDPGIPNLFPYKEKLLQEVEEKRMKKLEEAQRRKEMVKAASTGADEGVMGDVDGDDDSDDLMDEDDQDNDEQDDEDGDESNPMAALLASARKAAAKYEKDLADDDMECEDFNINDDSDDDQDQELETNEISVGQASSRKTYDKVFKKVVDEADVVLYVIDARDPEGTRSREVERSILAAAAATGKRLILVLNKIDLVPPQVLRAWLVHLRRYLPTLPLRASGAAANAHTFNHRDLTAQATSATLFRALKSFAASRNLKRAVSVGVIGYPNVGKSSVINALLARLSGKNPGVAARAACPAGAEAGVTTSIRSVKIDSKLTLLDSPGVVFPSASGGGGNLVNVKSAAEAHAHLVLLNAVPPKQIDDPIPAVSLLLRRLAASQDGVLLQKLTDLYDVPALLPSRVDGDVTADFLVQVARKRGRLGRGGVPNLAAAAMTVVTDWRDGRIQGWVEAPVLAVSSEDAATAGGKKSKKTKKAPAAAAAAAGDDEPGPDQKQIVTEWAAEFKLEGLWGDDGVADGDAMEQ
ncbi:nucleolar GTP-binding protein 2 [Cordyceps fumosorosea ARSEF 2679]|uniref:Nucleolar GTP-binding protein 2 n=1 Tax=Cordyceps fumosorosea (strain ARSEF 2679) TaxID=1081104 RepID=A0A167XEJ9_CORFA|nr:nucleolar GTP-binding protein 2 [Cordyceps fumosorosea ARSEF 2679]OAA64879.1 nucleolar GTP-binding protein 2 [Cordyceps fumosorosea ARSEF 2679]